MSAPKIKTGDCVRVRPELVGVVSSTVDMMGEGRIRVHPCDGTPSTWVDPSTVVRLDLRSGVEVTGRVAEIASFATAGSKIAAAIAERILYRDVLHAIATGEVHDAAALAREALSAEEARGLS
ncbi:hypothetical protein [Pendulispora albinea]|uniref:Uncharacterized protein n=1 Tax=Pendulispora albinea TaxID=2741071 RepID=A0ABZ2M222_9BACT